MTFLIGSSPTGGVHHGPHWGAAAQAHGNSVDNTNSPNEGTAAGAAPISAAAYAQLQAQLQAQAIAQQAAIASARTSSFTITSSGPWITSSVWASTSSALTIVSSGPAYAKLKLPHVVTAGEIIAWRCWRVANGWLRSVYMDTFWGCHEHMEGNPDTDGVHAWKKMQDAIEYGVMGGVHGANMKVIIGTVALWGEVIEHEIGYRAQFAKIKSLDHWADNSGNQEELQELRRKYLA